MAIEDDVRRAFARYFPETAAGNANQGFLQNSQAGRPVPTPVETDTGAMGDVRRAIAIHFPETFLGDSRPGLLPDSQVRPSVPDNLTAPYAQKSAPNSNWPGSSASANNRHDNAADSLFDAYLTPGPESLAAQAAKRATAGMGRFVQDDPLGQAEQDHTCTVVGYKPWDRLVDRLDQKGSHLMVITGGVKNGRPPNPFGHVATALGGYGMASYGTGTPLGSSVNDYLIKQGKDRFQQVTIIPVTPSQRAAAIAYIKGSHPNNMDINWLDNCAVRANQILHAANVPSSGIPFPGGTGREVQSLPGAMTYTIPQHRPIPLELQEKLSRFNSQ